MIFDTHAHYDDEQFNEDRNELLQKMPAEGVETIVNVSAAVPSWQATIQLTKEYDFIYGAIGVHPDEVGDLTEENFAEMAALLDQDKIVAVGEIGLDYYWDKEGHELQQEWFIRQLMLAHQKNLPVIIHSRDAAQDTLDIMKEQGQGLRGIIHCFSYSPEIALEYVKRGFHIGIGGVVTFKNAKKLKETVAKLPLEALVLETDCPYLTPVPNRGKRNSSLNLRYVAEEIAQIKGVPVSEVIARTTANAREIYRL